MLVKKLSILWYFCSIHRRDEAVFTSHYDFHCCSRIFQDLKILNSFSLIVVYLIRIIDFISFGKLPNSDDSLVLFFVNMIMSNHFFVSA